MGLPLPFISHGGTALLVTLVITSYSIHYTKLYDANIASNFSRFGGTIEGGIFLSHFAPKDVPWAHLDIAPRMEAIASDKLAKGATGEPVRLLVRFAEQYKA